MLLLLLLLLLLLFFLSGVDGYVGNHTAYRRVRRLNDVKSLSWHSCCADDPHKSNSDEREEIAKLAPYNYIFPISTTERLYFVISALVKLYKTTKSLKAFSIVEPYIKDTRLSVDGVSIFTYLEFEDAENLFTTRRKWNYLSSNNFLAKEYDLKNVVQIVPVELDAKDQFSCPNLLQHKFCYSFGSEKENKFYIQFKPGHVHGSYSNHKILPYLTFTV